VNARGHKWPNHPWARLWMQFAGTGPVGRLATRLAAIGAPPYKGRRYLARLSGSGYISPSARIRSTSIHLGRHIFLGDRVTIYDVGDGGSVEIGDGSSIHQDGIIEIGQGGCLVIGRQTHIQPRVQMSCYKGKLSIGGNVQIAPGCAFYPYDHQMQSGQKMIDQSLVSRGGITIEDDVWLGFGVIVLDGARIREGAVIGAGAVVKGEIAPGAIAAGVPARILSHRGGTVTQSEQP